MNEKKKEKHPPPNSFDSTLAILRLEETTAVLFKQIIDTLTFPSFPSNEMIK